MASGGKKLNLCTMELALAVVGFIVGAVTAMAALTLAQGWLFSSAICTIGRSFWSSPAAPP